MTLSEFARALEALGISVIGAAWIDGRWIATAASGIDTMHGAETLRSEADTLDSALLGLLDA